MTDQNPSPQSVEPTLATFETPDFAARTHVPHMESWAYNQMPKAGWSDLKLFQYDGTDLYQWFGKKTGSVFEDAEGEPFAIKPAAPAPSSLAGGEVRASVARLSNDASRAVEFGATNATVRVDDLAAILAALSPEAPAREVCDLEGLLTTALTDELQDGGAEVPYSIIAERVAARVADEATSAPSFALTTAAEEALSFLQNAPLESGICCCGDPISGHGYGSGHSPVDDLAYHSSQVAEKLQAALTPRHEAPAELLSNPQELEAPAEGVEWFGVTGATDETEALAVALFDARCPGIRMTDEDLHYYRAAAQRAMQAVADELDTPALTPRHEAPASNDWIEWDGGENPAPGQRVDLIMRGEPNIVETDLSDNMRWWHDHNTDGGDIIAYRPSSHEAPAEGAGGLGSPSQWCDFLPEPSGPAEGAGEREEAFCEAYYQAHLDHAWAALRDGKPYQVNSDGAISLIQQAAADRRAVKAWQMTARSSAPEALGNLLAVIHRDGGQRTLVVGVEQAAAEAEKIVARLLSSAPEAREGEAT